MLTRKAKECAVKLVYFSSRGTRVIVERAEDNIVRVYF
jgi:hypothetical protein